MKKTKRNRKLKFNKKVYWVVVSIILVVLAVVGWRYYPVLSVKLVNVKELAAGDAHCFKYTSSSGKNAIWQSSESGVWSTYLYNLAEDKLANLNSVAEIDQVPLGIDENNILMIEYNKNHSDYSLLLYDLGTSLKSKINNFLPWSAVSYSQHPETFPKVKLVGDRVIYGDGESVIVYNYKNGEKKIVDSLKKSSSYGLAMSDNKIAWVEVSGGTGSIKTYNINDGSTETIVTGKNHDAIDTVTQLVLNDEYLAWTDNRNCSMNIEGCSRNTDIYVYNFSNKKETRINSNKLNQELPYLSSDKLFWSDNRNGKLRGAPANDYQRDIFYADLRSKKEKMVYSGGNRSYNYVFGEFGKQVIWMEDNTNDAGTGKIKIGTIK